MTLTDIQRECPAPEGWGNWYPEMDLSGDRVVGYIVESTDGSAQVRIKDISSSGNAWNVSTFIRYKSSSSWVVETDDNLPSAYLRVLAVVGLAEDPEKVALRAEVAVLRRRLTWASEVPTEPGVYVVGRGVKPYDGSIMFRRWDEDEGKMERPWVDAFGLPWTDEQMKGRRFFALDNLKETP